ncbi:MAG TPA: helix-turn-helix domain-containing protein, partial [Acidimicrobiia bacterium]
RRSVPETAEVPSATGEVLTADEVASLLRMTTGWVYEQTRRNRIPHMRLGRYFRYRREAIEAWMGGLEDSSDAVRPLRVERAGGDGDRRSA